MGAPVVTGGSSGWGLIIAANNTYQALFGGVSAFGTNVATANTWTHLALVRASGVSTLYVNGVATVTNATDGPLGPSGNFALGVPPQTPTSQFFTGYIDEVRVFTFAAGQFNTNDLLVNQLNTPILTTTAPLNVTSNSANLTGTVNSNGQPTVAWFEYGPGQPLGFQTPPAYTVQLPSVFSQAVTGLTAGLTYHYRIAASNVFGITRGQDMQFWAPTLTVNGNNSVTVKHTWADTYGATPRAVPNGIAGGGTFSLVLKADGTIIGEGNAVLTNIPPSATNVVALAAGDSSGFALKADGTGVGWGLNDFGVTNIPPGLTNVVAISAHRSHALALKADGTVLGWGENTDGETNTPPGLTNVIGIAAGAQFSLALKGDGTIVGWGNNTSNQITIPVSATNVVAVAAGEYHSLAVKADGTVIAWGYDNGTGATNVPPEATNVVAVAASDNFSMALRTDGHVLSWGLNNAGQTNFIPGANSAIAIAAGFYHALDIRTDGLVVGWGNNTSGQIHFPTGLDVINLPVGSNDNVNVNVPGNYVENYFVTNGYGVVATASRNVTVIDSPTITDLTATVVGTNAANGLRTVRFSASINANGSATIATVVYGLTSSYGNYSTLFYINSPAPFTPYTVPFDALLSPGLTFHWAVVATNGYDSLPGTNFSPDQVFTVPAAYSQGDANGDGIVDQSELDAVYSNYLPNSPWLLMTNVSGLGQTNVTFALSNSLSGGYTVEVSTNLTNWQLLGPATPRYLFTDTNAPASPQRYYRLRYP